MSKIKTPTRYGRVVEILNKAAGESTADYGGTGRFWELPLEELLQVEVLGVRMIAPPEAVAKKSCCCGPAAGESDAAVAEQPESACPGRGAASGLIRGLRGQSPFDGSRFPPLPWGGAAVAADDIQFISEWIDDGCSATARQVESIDLVDLTAAPALEQLSADNTKSVLQATYKVYEGSPNEFKHQQGEIKQRVNIDCMTDEQLEKLRYAFRELYKLNKWPEDARNYNSLALIHQNHCQHGWERFLPWHRIYMYEFEQALQDHCPGVTVPYWDFTMPQYFPSQPEKGWIIPKALQLFLTKESLTFLEHATPSIPKSDIKKLNRLVGRCFASQSRFFREVATLTNPKYTKGEYRKRFVDALLESNSLWYPLRYPGEYHTSTGEPSTITQTIQYHYPTADDIQQILNLRTYRDFGGGSIYNDSFGFLDQNPHNTMHIWTGGMNPDDPSLAGLKNGIDFDRNRGVQVAGRRFHSRIDLYGQPSSGDMLSNLTAAYDPVFWPVHANIDRLWWTWQQEHPHAVPEDMDSVLTPWSYTIRDTLDMYRFGYEYVKGTYIIPVGLEAPVGKFVSKPINIPATVSTSFRQAEIRLHRVPQLPRSCFIRVFFNLENADAKTPLNHEHYGGYLAIFGHGPCYGGPGHCEIPARNRRDFDHRPRNHNTPRNHRIDVTKCVRSLMEKEVTSLTITLVVIGADYQEDNELLRLEGVSLNFLD